MPWELVPTTATHRTRRHLVEISRPALPARSPCSFRGTRLPYMQIEDRAGVPGLDIGLLPIEITFILGPLE